MGGFSGGAAAIREREYLFVDGGSLRASVRKISQQIFGDENAYRAHIPAFASGQFDKIFYYDAVPGRNYGETQAAYEARVQPDHERFAAIQALDRVHVALGQIVGSDRRQKGVDVRLAVDMMTHAFRGNITKATLFAADSDFIPLVRSLVNEGMHITLWHPAQANAELKGAADSVLPFEFKSDHFRFTADGRQSAYQIRTSGTSISGPEANGYSTIATINGSSYAGHWDRSVLEVWRRDPGGIWSFTQLHAPDATLDQALVAFDAIHGCDIALTGREWIKH